MKLQLQDITFSHSPEDPATSAYAIRGNSKHEVRHPEFVANRPIPRLLGSAAYSIADTHTAAVYIVVTFTVATPFAKDTTIEVQATGGGVLGALFPVAVTFSKNTPTAACNIPLSDRRFLAVGAHQVTWQWQWRDSPQTSWQPLQTTRHHILLTLAVPSGAWTQQPGNISLPWAEALTTSCTLAKGAQTPQTALRAITEQLHRRQKIKYDISVGAPRYGYSETGDQFALQDWLEYVMRGNAPGHPLFCDNTPDEYPDFLIVNGHDMAAATVLLAQAVGVPATYQYHEPFGKIGTVHPIGRPKTTQPFYGCGNSKHRNTSNSQGTELGNHAYAFFDDTVYDSTFRSWVAPLRACGQKIWWYIVLIVTFGQTRLQSVHDHAEGVFIALPPAAYLAAIRAASAPSDTENITETVAFQ